MDWMPFQVIRQPRKKNFFLLSNLLIILLSLVVDDVVEAELVDALGGRDHAQPVTELLLLEELLGPFLIVS